MAGPSITQVATPVPSATPSNTAAVNPVVTFDQRETADGDGGDFAEQLEQLAQKAPGRAATELAARKPAPILAQAHRHDRAWAAALLAGALADASIGGPLAAPTDGQEGDSEPAPAPSPDSALQVAAGTGPIAIAGFDVPVMASSVTELGDSGRSTPAIASGQGASPAVAGSGLATTSTAQDAAVTEPFLLDVVVLRREAHFAPSAVHYLGEAAIPAEGGSAASMSPAPSAPALSVAPKGEDGDLTVSSKAAESFDRGDETREGAAEKGKAGEGISLEARRPRHEPAAPVSLVLDKPISDQTAASPAGQIALEVIRNVRQSGCADLASSSAPAPSPVLKSITLQLEPAHLGKVVIEIELKDGAIRLNVHSQRADTAALLQQDQQSLLSLLKEVGYKVDALSIGQALSQLASGPADPLMQGATGAPLAFGGSGGQPPAHSGGHKPGARQPREQDGGASAEGGKGRDETANRSGSVGNLYV